MRGSARGRPITPTRDAAAARWASGRATSRLPLIAARPSRSWSIGSPRMPAIGARRLPSRSIGSARDGSPNVTAVAAA